MSLQKLNKYEKAERELGTLFCYSFADKIKQAAHTPPNSYATYDMWYCTFKEPDVSTIVEIKVRNFDVDKYDSFIIEKNKLKNLLKQVKEGKHSIYLNFFKNENGYYDAIAFDVEKRIPEWKVNGLPIENKWMNSATFRSTTKKVEKEVIMLRYNEKYDTKITNTQWKLKKEKL